MQQGLSKYKLLKKIRSYCSVLGHELLYRVFILFNTLKAPETPLWCRGVILGSLGYFLSTIDGIPDPTPVLGFSDDMTVLAAAIATVSQHITPEIKEKSEAQAQRIQERLGGGQDIPAS